MSDEHSLSAATLSYLMRWPETTDCQRWPARFATDSRQLPLSVTPPRCRRDREL